MCLEVIAWVAEKSPGRISAERLGKLAGLVVRSIKHEGHRGYHFSVQGGCSCGLLARGAHDHEGHWELEPKHLPKLATAIQTLNKEVRKYWFLAHWLGGATARTEVRMSGKELLKLVESNQVADNVAYRTWHGG